MKWFAAILCCLAGPVAAKSPAPDWYVEANVHHDIARLLAENCDELEFHHGGYDRHVLEIMGRLSDMQINGARPDFAPTSEFRKHRHTDAFLAKHGLLPDSPLRAFCAAGKAEREARTPIGLMLRLPR